MRVLLVDHQDSFVHTLGDYFRQQGAEVDHAALRFRPGPARPDRARPGGAVARAGAARRLRLRALLDEVYARDLPVFGVCLGLQAMVEHAGGALSLLATPAHGKPGLVRVAGGALLAGLADGEFTAARYHSLYATPAGCEGFEVTAVTEDDGVVMAIEDC